MRILFSALCMMLVFTHFAQAGILLESTRVIYPAAKREVTLSVTNNADRPRLIQAWVDDGDPDSPVETVTVPFIVTPPIFRVDPHKGQTLRIIFTGGNVPQDRESVFWLNVLEVQPKPAGNAVEPSDYVQFSVRSRLKIFYRPNNLPSSPEHAISSLRWRKVDGGLECENPSAFNVSIQSVSMSKGSVDDEDREHGMCPAKGRKIFSVKGKTGETVFFTAIDDYGGFKEQAIAI